MARTLLAFFFLAAFTQAHACSCFGPNTFCGVLNPPYENPEWWLPDAVVMAVPLQQYHYGMDVLIVQVFQGEMDNDTVRVWGDNGALCRLYTGWAAGDTLILGLHRCDLAGNTIQNPDYPPDLEREEDYMISGCGVYLLDFNNGMVSGPIDQPVPQTIALEAFTQLIGNCALPNQVTEHPGTDPLLVRSGAGALVLEWRGAHHASELAVCDTQGSVLVHRRWNGSAFALEQLATGAYLVEVWSGAERTIRKVMVE